MKSLRYQPTSLTTFHSALTDTHNNNPLKLIKSFLKMDFDKPNKGWIENETALPEKNRFSTILEIQGIMKVVI